MPREKEQATAEVNLSAAKRIVGIGRGFAGQETSKSPKN
jgi:electron transfer flavoprotein alpha subunit